MSGRDSKPVFRARTAFAAAVLFGAALGAAALGGKTVASAVAAVLATLLAAYLHGRRERRAVPQESDIALVAELVSALEADNLAPALARIANLLGAARAAVYGRIGSELRDMGSGGEQEGDPRVLLWMTTHPAPLHRERSASAPLGGLRRPVEEAFTRLGADLIVPLVHRDELVGLFVAAGLSARASKKRRATLRAIQALLAPALAHVLLDATTGELAETMREVEAAAEVRVDQRVQAIDACEGARVFAVRCRAADDFGGGWWAARPIGDHQLVLAAGDVTGGGVPATLVSATAAGAFEAALALADPRSPVEVIGLLESSVRRVGHPDHPMSVAVASLDAESGRLILASAGHPCAYLRSRRGRLSALSARGARLGLGAERTAFLEVDLEPGDILILYSGGLLEGRSPSGTVFGHRRLQRALRAADPIPGAICEGVLAALQRHTGGELRRDATILAGLVSGGANPAESAGGEPV